MAVNSQSPLESSSWVLAVPGGMEGLADSVSTALYASGLSVLQEEAVKSLAAVLRVVLRIIIPLEVTKNLTTRTRRLIVTSAAQQVRHSARQLLSHLTALYSVVVLSLGLLQVNRVPQLAIRLSRDAARRV